MAKADEKAPAEPHTDVRVTFRTYKTNVEKLERVAEAEDLRVGPRPSVGKALNHVIEKYEEPPPQKRKKKVVTHGR